MSAEGQTIRERVERESEAVRLADRKDKSSPEVYRAVLAYRDAVSAERAVLEARLAEAEGALRAAADVIDVALGADAHYLKNFPRTERHHAKRVLAAARAALPSESGTP